MPSLREAAALALEALEKWNKPGYTDRFRKSTTALRAALAEPVEPVAWLAPRNVDSYSRPDLGYETCSKTDYGAFPVYTAPPQRKPLTEEEIVDAVREADLDWKAGWTLDEHEPNRFTTLARAIERAHGIGEKE